MRKPSVSAGDTEERKGWLRSVNPSVLGFGIPIAVFGFYAFLGWLDDKTELWPRHDSSIEGCFVLAGLAALCVATFIVLKSKGTSFWQRVRLVVPLSLIGALGVGLFSMRIVDITQGWIDFPPHKTQTFQGLLRISRAYQTHGKGASRDIQTTPLWSDMNVTEDDYEFMLQHRRPGDVSNNPDEISSEGYFCAKVTLQSSGNALRVLHAGSRELPSGTVIICPQFSAPAPN